MIPSDLHLLQMESGRSEISEKEVSEEGRFHALHLSFSLPASAYATMLIREALGSSVEQQNALEITPETDEEGIIEE